MPTLLSGDTARPGSAVRAEWAPMYRPKAETLRTNTIEPRFTALIQTMFHDVVTNIRSDVIVEPTYLDSFQHPTRPSLRIPSSFTSVFGLFALRI